MINQLTSTNSEKEQYIANHYGVVPQMGQLQEECAELIQAVSKWNRGIDNCNLFEELADVEIMIDQIKYLMCADSEVERIKAFKLGRQVARIESEVFEDERRKRAICKTSAVRERLERRAEGTGERYSYTLRYVDRF